MSHKESLDLLETAAGRFEDAADALDIDAGLRAVLRYPRRQLVFSLPLLRDDGSIVMVEAHRVQHNAALGPSLGGVRTVAEGSPTDDVARAMSTTWRAALAGVPFGGAAGTLLADARALSEGERQRLARRYAGELARCAGSERDVIAPDLGTDTATLDHMLDTLSVARDGMDPGAVVGKSASLGGGEAIEGAAQGLAVCLREACHGLRKSLRTATVAVDGFGRVGARIADLAHTEGARIVAVSDSRGGAVAPRGLEPARLGAHKAATGSVVGFRGADRLSFDELLQAKCDAVVLCGPERRITTRNAHHLRCRIVAELSHGAVTPGAERLLRDRGVCVIPDVVAGVGGVLGAHAEWVRGRAGVAEDAESFRSRVVETQRRAVRQVKEIAGQRPDWRAAALGIAVARVADVVRRRGLFP
jgi:glutamate dehydrogenase (NAD(P)+)